MRPLKLASDWLYVKPYFQHSVLHLRLFSQGQRWKPPAPKTCWNRISHPTLRLCSLWLCHLISGTGQTIPETRLVKRLGEDVMVGRSFHLAYPRPFLGSQTPTENLPTTKLLPKPWRTGLWCGVTAKVALSSGHHQVTFPCLEPARARTASLWKERATCVARHPCINFWKVTLASGSRCQGEGWKSL